MTAQRFIQAVDATWPAAQYVARGPWTLRAGQGGGQRVSAATTEQTVGAEDVAVAEAGMAAMGQAPLFMVRPEQTALDHVLETLGYVQHDPVSMYACPPETLTDKPIPRVTVFAIWEPLCLMREIWDAGGVGPARQAVMARAAGPKTGFLARFQDKPAGAAFAAISDGVAMVHAVEILPHQRRKGMAQWIMRAAAFWARDHGADTLAVLCTDANEPANALYASLGMDRVGGYHYRVKEDD